MANQYGIDLAKVQSNIEGIKERRTVNKFNQMKLDEAKRNEASRPEREFYAKKKKQKLSTMRTDAMGGDIRAQERLLALDPVNGAKFISALGKLDDKRRKAAKKSVEEMGQMSAYILQPSDPLLQEERYNQVYKSVTEDIRSKLPEKFDPNFVQLSLAKAKSMDQLLEAPEVKKVGDQTRVYRDGKEVERIGAETKGVTPSQKLAREKYEKSISDKVQANLYKDIANLAGADVGADGRMIIFNKSAAKWNQAMTLALKYMSEKKYTTSSEAALEAAKKYGLVSKSQLATKSDDKDPLDLDL